MTNPPRKLTVDELLALGPGEALQRQAAEADTRDLWRVIAADGSRMTPSPAAGRSGRSRSTPRRNDSEQESHGRAHVMPAPVAERLAENLNVFDVFELPAVEPPRRLTPPQPAPRAAAEPPAIEPTPAQAAEENHAVTDDLGLLRVVESWPTLGPAVRAAILALIRVASRDTA